MDVYQQLDKVNININLSEKYYIIGDNSDSKSNNQLTWEINKNNYKNKNINLKFKVKDKNKEETIPTPPTKEDKNGSIKNKIIIFIGLALVCVISFVAIHLKKKHI